MSDCLALAGGYPQVLNFNIKNFSQKTPNFGAQTFWDTLS